MQIMINSDNKKRGKAWKCENYKDSYTKWFLHFHALPLFLLSLFTIINIVISFNFQRFVQ